MIHDLLIYFWTKTFIGIVQGSNGCFMTNLKVAYTWNFFDGIISIGSLDHKTKECHFMPLGHFPEMGQIHNGVSRFGLP